MISVDNKDGLLGFFVEICGIPHGSGNEKALSDYLVGFAQSRGLWAHQDEANNVIIRKAASPGYEDAKPVIIQGHMDMVCEKENGCAHDFENEGIRVVVDGDYIKAEKTTLGADNGIAVAMAMALLDAGDIPHPALEIMLTTNEETGMDGAKAIDPGLFAGRRLINLDNESDDACFVGCAGGRRCDFSIPLEYESSIPEQQAYRIQIAGLQGGHSGMTIDKQRANAIRLLARLLFDLSEATDIDIASIEGGSKENAIPREAECVVVLQGDAAGARLMEAIEKHLGIYRNELAVSDPGLTITATPVQPPRMVLTKECAWGIMSAALLLPDGVQTMDMSLQGQVESSANIGILEMADEYAVLRCSLRSQVSSLKELQTVKIKTLAELLGAEAVVRGDYPAWEFARVSPLRELYAGIYKELHGEDIRIAMIHAGLECGIFAEKFPGIDMISIGPNMSSVHTPREMLSISSTFKLWELLKKLLENMR